ncbi:MerR family transcriptional regulator [Streptomyces werraensis]|uniref:MerR family transcriptional regulator n=1 Tax=Streptomyces werraensis TaxID=68284 RepID=UPI0033A7DCBC
MGEEQEEDAIMALRGLTIGQVARVAGVTPKAVRVYEAKGLLPVAERSSAGYRLYDDQDVELLALRRARALGLHLDDIREVLAIRDGGVRPCATVRDLLDARITEIDDPVSELMALRKTLADARQRADDRTYGGTVTVCAITENA